jgi:hypothetical protein
MPGPGRQQERSGPAAAMAAVTAGLAGLAGTDMAGLTTGEQADLLRALGVAEARVVAARSAVLAAFGASRGYEADGAGSARAWLRWQTRVTPQAAAAAGGWARRLAAHPDVAAALAAGVVSPSWARCICEWTSGLPVFGQQQDADKVLLAAACGARSWPTWPGWRRRSPAGAAALTATPAATGSPAGT